MRWICSQPKVRHVPSCNSFAFVLYFPYCSLSLVPENSPRQDMFCPFLTLNFDVFLTTNSCHPYLSSGTSSQQPTAWWTNVEGRPRGCGFTWAPTTSARRTGSPPTSSGRSTWSSILSTTQCRSPLSLLVISHRTEDNDVALLRLKRPILMGARVQVP